MSSREHQVFSLIIEGNSVTDIASQLDRTVSTVSDHLRGIKEKLEAAIVRYAHRACLIDGSMGGPGPKIFWPGSPWRRGALR